jgi:hypothetical protein
MRGRAVCRGGGGLVCGHLVIVEGNHPSYHGYYLPISGWWEEYQRQNQSNDLNWLTPPPPPALISGAGKTGPISPRVPLSSRQQLIIIWKLKLHDPGRLVCHTARYYYALKNI